MDVLLDSNILIYSSYPNSSELRDWLDRNKLFISLITKLEVLGYHKISKKEEGYLNDFIKYCIILPIDNLVVDKAISLRQIKSMSLGDSIVGATAINEEIPLMTANTDDFNHLSDIELINPFKDL